MPLDPDGQFSDFGGRGGGHPVEQIQAPPPPLLFTFWFPKTSPTPPTGLQSQHVTSQDGQDRGGPPPPPLSSASVGLAISVATPDKVRPRERQKELESARPRIFLLF